MMKAYRGSKRIAPLIRIHVTKWRLVVNFAHCLLTLKGGRIAVPTEYRWAPEPIWKVLYVHFGQDRTGLMGATSSWFINQLFVVMHKEQCRKIS